MIYLILTIICSVLLFLVFKGFQNYNVETLPAIVVNYWVCVIIGVIASGTEVFSLWQDNFQMVYYGIGLSFFFISSFFILAKTVAHFGISVATVSQKMSMVLTIVYGYLAFTEKVSSLQFNGILLALLAMILINIPNNNSFKSTNKRLLFLPVLLFVFNGVIETTLYHLERANITSEMQIMTTYIFLFSGILGTIILILIRRFPGRKEIVGGIVLGIPNFGSIYFLLMTIYSGMSASFLFPTNNISILILSSISAWIVFKERLSKIKILGLIVGVLSILLLT